MLTTDTATHWVAAHPSGDLAIVFDAAGTEVARFQYVERDYGYGYRETRVMETSSGSGVDVTHWYVPGAGTPLEMAEERRDLLVSFREDDAF